MTRTYAIAEVTEATYREIERLLRAAGYEHAIDDGVIDMHGIALRAKKDERLRRERCGVEGCRLPPEHDGLHAFGNNIP